MWYLILSLLIAIQLTLSFSMKASLSSDNTNRLSRWQSRWDENQLGWHITNVHEALYRFGDKLIPHLKIIANTKAKELTPQESVPVSEEGRSVSWTDSNYCSGEDKPFRILFPLCGKSLDMAFLAKSATGSSLGQGNLEVVGIDGIAKSLEIFASEHPELDIRPQEQDPHRFRGKNILLIQNDFFLTDTTTTDGPFDAIFDRASLVAIHPTLREDYVSVIGKLLRPGGRILLVVIERTGGDKESGPPYSVPESQVRALYEGREWVQSVTLLDDDGEKNFNVGRDMRSLFFLIATKTGESVQC